MHFQGLETPLLISEIRPTKFTIYVHATDILVKASIAEFSRSVLNYPMKREKIVKGDSELCLLVNIKK